MPTSADSSRELHLLEQIEANPEVTQADLAEALGVAVGTVNFALRRLIKNGYVRATHLQRRRLKYILTPAGLALRSKLAVDSLQYAMRLYRETRQQARQLILEARQKGYAALSLCGDGDLAEIARLTCLELNMPIVPRQPDRPCLTIRGTSLVLEEPPA